MCPASSVSLNQQYKLPPCQFTNKIFLPEKKFNPKKVFSYASSSTLYPRERVSDSQFRIAAFQRSLELASLLIQKQIWPCSIHVYPLTNNISIQIDTLSVPPCIITKLLNLTKCCEVLTLQIFRYRSIHLNINASSQKSYKVKL